MRIKISLLPVQNSISRRDFELYYREAVNGWIYSMLRETDIHDQQTPVKFCFSSLRGFQPGDTELRNDRWVKDKRTGKKYPRPYYFLISTPRKDVALKLVTGLRKYLSSTDEKIIFQNLKDVQFRLVDIKTFGTEIDGRTEFVSDTPVIFKDYSDPKKFLLPSSKKFRYVFENHINRKVNEITGKRVHIGEMIKVEIYNKGNKINKTLSLFKLSNGEYLKVTGPRLKFKIPDTMSYEERKLLAQVFDSGIGSYTTYGCGFINIRKVDAYV